MATGNSVNANSAGIAKYDGSGNWTGVTVTQHDVLVGAASNGITSVAPSSTSGIPLVSNGSSSDPSFTTAVVAGGGTGDTSFTAYMPITGGTSTTGALQSIATGTKGQVLTYQTSSSLPTWTGAGSLVLISSQTASSSASITFTSGINSTYNNYLLLFTNVITASNSVNLELQISTNGGSSYIATGYTSGLTFNGYNSNTWGNQNSSTFFYLVANTSSTNSCAGYVFLQGLTGGGQISISGNTVYSTLGAILQGNSTSNTANAFKIFASSGNITSGTFTLFGVLE